VGVALLDTGAVIGFVQPDDAFHDPAVAAIARLATEHQFVLSAITYAELMAGVHRRRKAEDLLRSFLSDFVREIVAVDERVAEQAGALRAQLGLKLPDALILATAELAPADAGVVTTDGRWRRVRSSVAVLVLRS
jgi:predicted nucleic acid-binding protein